MDVTLLFGLKDPPSLIVLRLWLPRKQPKLGLSSPSGGFGTISQVTIFDRLILSYDK